MDKNYSNDNINEMLTAYIERIYGYSIKNTFSRDEADELSQEILLTVLKQFPTLADKEKFEPWLWGIASNVTKSFRRKQGKQRAVYSYNSHESFETMVENMLQYTDEYSFIDEEIYEQLRTKITQLSKIYRDIIVLHYYDNLTCREISEKLNIPEGTVTWRLSEGRKKLKEEYINMNTTINALRPISLDISMHGNFDGEGLPQNFINDALSQNILCHCYAEAKSVEDLSKSCGVPAFYIEDMISRLLYREALTESVKGKYQTDFLIYGNDQAEYAEKSSHIIGGIAEEFCDTLREFTGVVLKLGVYTGGKSVNELHYLFGALVMEHLSKKYNPLKQVSYKERYDGQRWKYVGHVEGAKANLGMGSSKTGWNDNYFHNSYQFNGFFLYQQMGIAQTNVCEKIFFKHELSEDEKETTAALIEVGRVTRQADGELVVNIPFITLDQKKEFDALVDKYFAGIAPKITDIVKRYTDGYMKLFPTHLKEDVEQAMYYFFIGGFYANITKIARDRNLLEAPAPDTFCDAIIQYK